MEEDLSGRWRRLDRLLDGALDRPASEREAWLRAECDGDDALVRDVLDLLESGERDDDFLAASAAEQAADLLKASLPSDSPFLPDSRAQTRIGPFRLVREIGRGGMGAVYLAERQEHFQQRVALKLIHQNLRVDADLMRRFHDERQILATLEHANIARLVDGGLTDDGDPWFAMEYIEGDPVDRWCDAQRLSIESRVELFCTICDAVEYAHERNIVHRDLKPSNIVVREDGVVKLLDFGVARLLARDPAARPALTRPGLRMLTPEYASPEQIRGEEASPASDVYSLGVLLYELLTGVHPSNGPSAGGSLIERVLTQDPERPSAVVARLPVRAGSDARSAAAIATSRAVTPERLRRLLRRGLDDIVLHALARDTAARYERVSALSADLRRYLQGNSASAPRRSAWGMRKPRSIAAAVLLAAAGGVLVWQGWTRATGDTGAAPVLAVGMITDFRPGAQSAEARPLADLLATNLARINALQVVSTARLYELMAELGTGATPDAGVYAAVARRAGASILIDGALFVTDRGTLRLDLRRNAIETGSVLGAQSVFGGDIFALVDSGTARLAVDFGFEAPRGSVSDVTTRSEAASRFYDEGVRAYYRGDRPAARALFAAAFGEDTTWAMAAWFVAQTDASRAVELVPRALELAARASDRDRLFIRSDWGLLAGDPSVVATAESLAVRYPLELDGQYFSALATARSGDYATAARRLRAVIRTDSASLDGGPSRCRRCAARREIVFAFLAIDSLAAAEREARTWTAVQPEAPGAWLVLADVLFSRGRPEEAREAQRQAASLDPSLLVGAYLGVAYDLARNDYDQADRRLEELTRTGSPDQQADAQYYLAISLRRQGRFEEALAAARAYRSINLARFPGSSLRFVWPEAQALLDLRMWDAATALLDSLAAFEATRTGLSGSRTRIAPLTAKAAALIVGGEVQAGEALADTIEQLGAQSLLAADRSIHHYVRGLVHVQMEDDASAVGEFRAAITSPVAGDPRAKLELARVLIRQNRPREAVAVLQPVLHAWIAVTDGNITLTDLDETLGLAWDAAGVPDSALVHYHRAGRAWVRADPALRQRVAAIESRIERLENLR